MLCRFLQKPRAQKHYPKKTRCLCYGTRKKNAKEQEPRFFDDVPQIPSLYFYTVSWFTLGGFAYFTTTSCHPSENQMPNPAALWPVSAFYGHFPALVQK